MPVERNVVEQRYEAVMAVVRDGRQVSEVARVYGVTRQTMHAWVSKYEASGMSGLLDASHRPHHSPLQTAPEIEASICELRRRHPAWGPRRISHELVVQNFAVSRASVYRILVRQHLIEPGKQKRRPADFKRWERSRPMELWQMDIVGGVILESGNELKVVTSVDDHSRFCVAVGMVERATSPAVCRVFVEALRRHGVPEEILTDNGKVFTNRHNKFPMLESAFDRICRENGIVHRLTGVRSPTTTGKIERFHRTLREELLTGRRFADIDAAQAAIDGWASTYNKDRPHQSLGMLTPITRFHAARPVEIQEVLPVVFTDDCAEVQRRVATRGHVTIAKTQYAVGCAYAGQFVTVRIETSVVHCLIDGKLVKTLPRRHTGDVRHLRPNKKHRSRRAADARRRAIESDRDTQLG
jgi:transposase InsO family protein